MTGRWLAAALVALAGLGAGTVQAEDFPRESYAEAQNGVAAPFVGHWMLRYPEPEGTIVSAILVDCDDPVVIEAVDDTTIAYRSPAMDAPVQFALSAFAGRTSWFPEAGNSSIAVWLTPDRFHIYRTDIGKAVWDDPRLMERCEA
ncbi:hypothetical protein [Devosia sp.]|uniref:hypothetical protein n=1 Tax=Devosia sp. TaxID=1871048 RepID=UPI003A8C89A8